MLSTNYNITHTPIRNTDSVLLMYSTASAYKKETISTCTCLVAVKLQSPTTQLTPQQITTTALFTTFHVQGNPHVHMSNCQNGTRSRDDHGVIPVLFGWCFRVSPLHAVVYILKTFLLYTMLTFFLLFFS